MSYKYDEHFKKKNNIIILLIIISGVLIPTFETHYSFDFWNNLNHILVNPYNNMLLFLACIINVNNYNYGNKYRFNIINRYASYRKYMLNEIKDIIIINACVYVSYILIAIASAILFSFGLFGAFSYGYYDISIVTYEIFFIIRGLVIITLICIGYYILLSKNNRYFTFGVILMVLCCFIIPSMDSLKIGNIYVLYSSYFTNLNYSSFLMECLSSILYIVLLVILVYGEFFLFSRKKRDII